jgi:tetratricopeptide (TPR) repeat protein
MKNQKITVLIKKAKASAEAQNIQQEKIAIIEILKHSPVDHFFIERLGDIENALGGFKEAEKLFEAIINKNKTPQLLYKLGMVKTSLGKLKEAVGVYSEVINLNKDFFEVYYNLGVVLLDSGFHEEAITNFKKFLEYYPDYPDVYLNLGVAYHALKIFDDAIFSYQNAIRIQPDFAEAYNNLGNIYSELEKNQEAILNYKKAIKINFNYFEPYNGIAVLHHEMNNMIEALHFYNKSIAINQNYPEGYNNLGNYYYEVKEHKKALDNFDRALKITPHFFEALFNKSMLKLSLGEYREGFILYESRKKIKGSSKLFPNFREPFWLGEEPLDDKIIYIYSEQGFGDIIQFSRYIKILSQKGCRGIIFDVPKELNSLMKNSFQGNIQVISGKNKDLNFDFQCPLMSLPLAFKTEVKTIPNFYCYLKPKKSLVDSWDKKLSLKNRKRVGIAWSGGFRGSDPLLRLISRRKAIPLDMLKTLFEADLDFFSLQKGELAELELKKMKVNSDEIHINDFSSEFNNFEDTAALIENLDLVITVCTSIAHLSAALGKQTWVLIPYENCWRWFDDFRTDSPWYPTIKLFRQSKSGDWEGVIGRVHTELKNFQAII